MIVVLVGGLGAAMIQLQAASTRAERASADTKRALCVAEAGIAEAFSAIAVGKTGNVGTVEQPARFGEGVYWVEASDDGGDRVLLKSIGLVGSGRFCVETAVQRQVNPLGVNGCHGRDAVTVSAGAIVDGYDSELGSYQSQLDGTLPHPSTGSGARITTNGDLILRGDQLFPGDDTFVYGDARPGAEGSVSIDPDVVVTGSTDPLMLEVATPPLQVPDLGRSQGTRSARAGRTMTLNRSARYDALTADPGGTVRLEGPAILHVDRLELPPAARLEIDNSRGPVVVFVSRELLLSPGSEVHSVQPDPTGTALYLGRLAGDGEVQLPEGSRFLFEASGTFHGTVCAPRQDLVLPAGLRVFGALSARTVTLAAEARFTYDAALARSSGLGVDSFPRLLSWRLDDLPEVDLVRRRVDPLLSLRRSGVAPARSAQSHRENYTRLHYTGNAGNALLFAGEVSCTPWGTVARIDGIQWRDPDSMAFFPAQPAHPRSVCDDAGSVETY